MWPALSVIAVVLVMVLVWRWWSRRAKSESPMVSIVMLRSAPLALDPTMLKQLARNAYRKEFEVVVADPTAAVTIAVLMSPQMPCNLVVMDAPMSYARPTDMAENIAKIEHPLLRDAYGNHTAWASVAALGPPGNQRALAGRAATYTILARLVETLADDKCLMLFLPAERAFLTATPENIDRLKNGDATVLTDDPDSLNAPIVQADDDAAMKRAKEAAIARLPEFLALCGTRLSGSNAMAKVCLPLEETNPRNREFIWVDVTGLRESSTGLMVQGTITNRPIHEGVPARGQPVEFPADRIVDWMYVDAKGRRQGGFIERLLLQKL